MALTAMVSLAGPLRADEPAPPGKFAPTGQSLPAYGDWNQECLEWTDSCAVCKRGEEAGVAARFVCSTPGIACQPKGIVCQRRAGSPVKP